MEFRILGSVQIYDDRADLRIVPSGVKQRALLGALVVSSGKELPAGRLVDELWGDNPPAHAANALQAHVTRLRRLLRDASGTDARDGRLSTRPTGYVLRADDTSTDAHRFHQLVAGAQELTAGDPGRSVQLLRSALSLWRGRAFEGSERGPICSSEASILEEARMAALELLYDASLRAGQYERVAGELEGLTASHPLRERFCELLMISLYRCGRRAEALGAYERVHRRLIRDLGVEPGPSLRRCREAILYHSHPDLVRDGAPEPVASAAGARPHVGVGVRPEEEMGVRLLRDEVAALQRRVDQLFQEQQVLVDRITRLTGTEVPSLPVP
ncbi:BTAD domain-containing putative transcriptional regulator [Streptomyces sp. NPDC050439]|uniref:AfsR/SARP family transcriptional regulator n=1 Tax=unclassified Streptomyces TaxID=2593676 RepID=UPI003443540A